MDSIVRKEIFDKGEDIEWICEQLENIIPDVRWDDNSVLALKKAIELLRGNGN